MTDIAADTIRVATPPARRDIGLKKRYAAERRFRIYGQVAISIGLIFLAIMLPPSGRRR
jgi:phosphate transport system permease protein